MSSRPQTEGLDEEEIRLLSIFSKNSTGAGIYTLEGLAKDIGASPDLVYRKILSLEEKGYLRILSVSEPLSNTSELADRLSNCLHQTLRWAQKIEDLMERKDRTKERVYQKVFKDLLQRLDEGVKNMGALAEDFKAELERMDRQVEECEERIEELKIREEIGDITKEQATKLLKSYQSDLEEILKRKDNLLIKLSGKRSEVIDEGIEKKLEEVSDQIQSLWVRHQVGEISEEEYDKRKRQLEEERKSLLQTSERQGELKKAAKEMMRAMRGLGDKDALLDKVGREALNQLRLIFELAGAWGDLLGESE